MAHRNHPSTVNPLDGVRVLDLSQGIAGPYCGLILRQQGAEVIKVEPPKGDWARRMGRQTNGMSAIFAACNAGKKGICLDVKTEAGRKQLLTLTNDIDILVESYRPGVTDRMGIGWDTLSLDNPSLIYTSISGWGSTGPMAQVPAVDTTMQAASGIMFANRDADGQPRRFGVYIVDLSTGLYAAQAILSALLLRAKIGQGRHISVTMLSVAAALQSYLILDAEMYGSQTKPFVATAPSGLYDTSDDRQVYIAALNDGMFKRLATALELSAWLTLPELQTSAGRVDMANELNTQLAKCISAKPLEHWLTLLPKHDVLFAPIQTPWELPKYPQAQATEIFSPYPVTGFGIHNLPHLPGTHDAISSLSSAPTLGQHNLDFLL